MNDARIIVCRPRKSKHIQSRTRRERQQTSLAIPQPHPLSTWLSLTTDDYVKKAYPQAAKYVEKKG